MQNLWLQHGEMCKKGYDYNYINKISWCFKKYFENRKL